MTWIPGHRLAGVMERAEVTLTEAERRLLGDLQTGRQQFVSLHRADRILTRLDLSDFWHLPETLGGLADIYEDGVTYGAPNYASANLRPAVRRYETETERVEARRDTWRRYYRRRRDREEAA